HGKRDFVGIKVTDEVGDGRDDEGENHAILAAKAIPGIDQQHRKQCEKKGGFKAVHGNTCLNASIVAWGKQKAEQGIGIREKKSRLPAVSVMMIRKGKPMRRVSDP